MPDHRHPLFPNKPRTTPKPYREDDDAEPTTNPGMTVDVAYLKRKLAEELAESEKHVKNSGWIRSGALLLGLIGTIGLGYQWLLNEARAQARREIAATDAGLKGLDARVTTTEKRLDRIDDKLDLALDALRVPLSKRPPPVDGGNP